VDPEWRQVQPGHWVACHEVEPRAVVVAGAVSETA
jgi:hypothetical protein